MSFFCPMVVGKKFPWKTYNVSKRSRENGMSHLHSREESEAYVKNANAILDDKRSNKTTSNGQELSSLLMGASLENPADVKATVLWNYAPTHATDISARKGDVVRVFYRNGEWLFVENSKGSQGFIPFNFCTLTPNENRITGNFTTTKQTEENPELRVFENEGELPTVLENRRKLREDVSKRATSLAQTSVGTANAFEVTQVQDNTRNTTSNNEYAEIDVVRITSEVPSQKQNAPLLVSSVDKFDQPTTTFTKEGSSGPKNGCEKQRTDESKCSECSNNESSGTQSDASERRKGLRFLPKRKRQGRKEKKREKKKDIREGFCSRNGKVSGDNPLLDSSTMDSWHWDLYDTDSSSDSSDDEAVFKEILSHRESRGSFRGERFTTEESFITGHLLRPNYDSAYALAEQIIYQKDQLLATCDDIMWSARYGSPGRDPDITTKTKHYSMLLEDNGPVYMISGAKSQDLTSGFAQVRKLTTSTQLEDIRDQLSKLQMKELCVPKPKCLIDEDFEIKRLAPGGLEQEGTLPGCELLEEPLNEELMVVIQTFTAENSEELSVTVGERVFVCNACEHEDWWWANTVDGREGFVPKSYLAAIESNDAEMSVGNDTIQAIPSREVHSADCGKDENLTQHDNVQKPEKEEDSHKNTIFPRLMPLSERSEIDYREQKSDSASNRGPLKMAMVAPTVRTDIASKTDLEERTGDTGGDDLVKKASDSGIPSPTDNHRFHSYENINSELFLDSVRKHLELIDSNQKVDENTDFPKPCLVDDPVDDSDDMQDPQWVSAYLSRYTNRANKHFDDRPRALRRRDTIASTRTQGKRVRFQSNPNLSSGCGDPMVTIHRYEVDTQDGDDVVTAPYVVKSGTYGEMELATWC